MYGLGVKLLKLYSETLELSESNSTELVRSNRIEFFQYFGSTEPNS